MATLQSALADPHGTSAQRRTAYRVMMGYILGLSDASLAENLSTIVVRGRRGGGWEADRQADRRGEGGYKYFFRCACMLLLFLSKSGTERYSHGPRRERERERYRKGSYDASCT